MGSEMCIRDSASTVGSFDLGLYKTVDGSNEVLKDLENHMFEIVYLLGVDNLKFEKKNEFVIYQGSHGDKGAEIADIILPGAAYTEQNGYFTNLEGKMQKAYKASYPPEEAKEEKRQRWRRPPGRRDPLCSVWCR